MGYLLPLLPPPPTESDWGQGSDSLPNDQTVVESVSSFDRNVAEKPTVFRNVQSKIDVL